MRRFSLLLAVIGLMMGLLAPSASAAAPYCGITWGSQAKEGGSSGGDSLTGVRIGQHDCYDRMVIDLDAPASVQYWVRHVDEVRTDGEGAVVPLRGGASFLEIVVMAPYQGTGWRVGDEVADVTGYRTFREIAYAGAFEGNTTFGMGARARLPFRAFTLSGPGEGSSRLVIDVAHRW
jgi:hypothetical protein